MSNPKHSKLLTYLENSGALASGDKERIRTAKAEYRRTYMRNYKRRYRATHAETRIILNREERTMIDRAAHEHRMERPGFMRHAALAYIGRTFIVPNKCTVASVEQGIAAIATELRHLAREGSGGLLERTMNHRKLLARVERLEEFVYERLRHPPELEGFLRERGIDDAALTKRIREILRP